MAMKFVEIEECSGKTIMANGVHVISYRTLLIGFTDETCTIVEAESDTSDGELNTNARYNDDLGRQKWLTHAGESKEFKRAILAIGLLTQAEIDTAVEWRRADMEKINEEQDRLELARLKAKYETVTPTTKVPSAETTCFVA